jgi:hypothetical protein
MLKGIYFLLSSALYAHAGVCAEVQMQARCTALFWSPLTPRCSIPSLFVYQLIAPGALLKLYGKYVVSVPAHAYLGMPIAYANANA